MLTRKALAAALGIGAPMVTKHARAGMPTDSVAAAEAWRRAKLNPTLTKANRIDGRSGESVAHSLARVDRLWPVARAAIEAGGFATVEPQMRAALAAVPAEARGRVLLDVVVMDALTEHVARELRSSSKARGAGALTEDEAEDMGDFWFAVAAGEPLGRWAA